MEEQGPEGVGGIQQGDRTGPPTTSQAGPDRAGRSDEREPRPEGQLVDDVELEPAVGRLVVGDEEDVRGVAARRQPGEAEPPGDPAEGRQVGRLHEEVDVAGASVELVLAAQHGPREIRLVEGTEELQESRVDLGGGGRRGGQRTPPGSIVGRASIRSGPSAWLRHGRAFRGAAASYGQARVSGQRPRPGALPGFTSTIVLGMACRARMGQDQECRLRTARDERLGHAAAADDSIDATRPPRAGPSDGRRQDRGASPRDRSRRLHRPPPGDLPQGARLLGPRRRHQGARVHRDRRRRVRAARPPAPRGGPRGDPRRRPRLRARGGHGRHGLHLRQPRRRSSTTTP